MTTAPVRLLLLEDNPGDARLVQAALAEHVPGEFAITTVERLADALARIGAEPFDVMLCDLGLPDSVGLATAQAIATRVPALPLVVLTGSHDQNLGRQAIQHGAQDYLVKGESGGALIARTLRYAIERKRLEIGLRTANEALEHRVAERTGELETSNRSLRASETRYRALFDNMLNGFAYCKMQYDDRGRAVDFTYLAVNDAFGRLTGLKDVVGRPVTEVIPGIREVSPDLFEIYGRVASTGASETFEIDFKPLGKWLTVTAYCFERGCFAATFDDITERKRAEQALLRQKDLYEMLSQTNQAIVRITSRKELLPAVCRVAVEHGHFRFAWVGLIDKADQRVKPVAEYGEDGGYVDQVYISAGESDAAGRGPTGQALRTGEHAVSNDFLNDPATAPWHEAARRAGVRASAALPIRQSGAVVGAINLYAGEPRFFTEDVLATLGEMAIDVSYALDNFAHEAERKQAEEALRAAEEQFRGLVEQSIAGIYIIQDGKFAYVNRRFAEIRGYASVEELIGREVMPLITEKDRDIVAENTRRLLAGETRSINYSFTALRKDGSTVEVGVHSSFASHGGRPAIIGLMQDISEKKRAEEQINRYVVQLENTFMRAVEIATTLSEMRDPYTSGHERRVGEIAAAIGAELGFDARRVEGLRVAGYLHDVGKITIPSEILSKPGRLNAVEFKLIQEHAQASYDILKNVEFPWPVAQVALQHHERMDGSGYPQGLKGEAILPEARILAVADTIEAMSSHRPYRPGLGIAAALSEIERGRGAVYDPDVADACLRLFREKGYTIPI